MRPDRKTLQLCRQVERALHLAFADAYQDEILQQVAVTSVAPAPDSRHLAVLVEPVDPKSTLTAEEVLPTLFAASPYLRNEIANAINRRKTPELSYQFRSPLEATRDSSERGLRGSPADDDES